MKKFLLQTAFLSLSLACKDNSGKQKLDSKERGVSIVAKDFAVKNSEPETPPQGATDKADTGTAEPLAENAPKLSNENFEEETGILRKIYNSGGRTTIAVDFVQVVDAKENSELPYRIENSNPKIRYFGVDSSTEIDNCITQEKVTPGNIKNYEPLMKKQNFMVFTIKNGVAKHINLGCFD